MFFNKKNKKKKIVDNEVVWEEGNNRILLNNNKKLIVERKMRLDSYHCEPFWAQESNPMRVMKAVGRAYLKLLLEKYE